MKTKKFTFFSCTGIPGIILGFLLLIGNVVQVSGQNLVKNPGFEDTTTLDSTWQYASPATDSRISTVQFHSGKQSLEIGSTQNDAERQQILTGLVVGGTYKYTAWVNRGVGAGSLYAGVKFYDKDGLIINDVEPDVVTANATWTFTQITFVIPTGTVNCNPFIYQSKCTSQLSYVDDISLVQILPATGVSLDFTSLNLTVGNTKQLTASILPNDTNTDQHVVWTSTNNSVATVSDGLVTAVAPGTDTITVITAAGPSAICVVTIKDIATASNLVVNPGFEDTAALINTWQYASPAADSRISTVQFHSGKQSLEIGSTQNDAERQQILTGLTVGATYKYSAWVNRGVGAGSLYAGVKFYDAGDVLLNDIEPNVVPANATWTYTEITFVIPAGTVKCNPFIYQSKCASQLSYVDDISIVLNVPDTSVSLDLTSVNLIVGGTQQLTPTILPTNTTTKTIIWSSSSNAIATVSNGLITAVAAGVDTITATSPDGPSAICVVTITDAINNPNNLVINPGFEDTTALINTWQYASPAADSRISKTQFHSGKQSLEIGSTQNDAERQQILTGLVVGGTYKYSAWVNRGVGAGSLYAGVKFFDKDGNTINDVEPDVVPATATWTYTEVTFVIPAGTVKCNPFIYQNKCASQLSYVDDISIVLVSLPATSITLDITSIQLGTGVNQKLTATILPADPKTDTTINWTSSDNSIATVTNGIVTAIAAGTTTITAATPAGPSATCDITVIDAVNLVVNPGFEDSTAIAVTWQIASPAADSYVSTLQFHSGKHSLQIGSTQNDANRQQQLTGVVPGATYKYSAWLRKGIGAGKLYAGVMFYDADGFYINDYEPEQIPANATWTYTELTFVMPDGTVNCNPFIYQNQCASMLSYVDDVSLTWVSGPVATGVKKITETSPVSVSLYPNPINRGQSLNIVCPEEKNVTMYDLTGRLVLSRKLGFDNQSVELDNSIITGTYIVRVATNKGVTSKLIIVK